jgi:hypothetical protein
MDLGRSFKAGLAAATAPSSLSTISREHAEARAKIIAEIRYMRSMKWVEAGNQAMIGMTTGLAVQGLAWLWGRRS